MSSTRISDTITYDSEGINYDDIPEISDFSKWRKNPHAKSIKEKGYSVTIHYAPEDVENKEFDDSKDILQALVELMSTEDRKRLLQHIKDNFNIPCSPSLWEGMS